MKLGTIIVFLIAIFFSGCSQYKDPELALKIEELESKEHKDEMDKEELRDLKEQAKYGLPQLSQCKNK